MATTLVTLEKLKEYVKEPTANTRHDETLQAALDGATQMIQDYCDRLFIKDSQADPEVVSARTYQADHPYRLYVRDFHTATGLIIKTDETDDGTYDTTWTVTTDYLSGPSDQRTGYPFYLIEAVGSKSFPCAGRRPRVEVTAFYGWAAVPDAVQSACLELAAETWKRGDAPFGQAGFDDFSEVRVAPNPNRILSRLKVYKRFPVLVA